MKAFKRDLKSFLAVFLATSMGCGGSASSPFNNTVFQISSKNHLYVASGSCYGGGVAISLGAANTVTKFDLTTGALEKVVIDYNEIAPGDSPVGIYDYDLDNILVLVENAAGRRIDKVRKDGGGASSYILNAAAFNTTLRSIAMLSDSSLLIAKDFGIEKFNSAKARVTIGASSYVLAPAGACANSNTFMSSVTAHSTGKIVYTHAAASPDNRIGVINANGYSSAADCLDGIAGPTATALPTRALFHSNGKLLVSYGSTTAASNFIYSYDFNSGTGALTNPVAVYSDSTVVNGPSAMAQDPDSGDVFVANANSAFNTVERFSFASNLFTRVAGATFIPPSIYTRCITDVKVMY